MRDASSALSRPGQRKSTTRFSLTARFQARSLKIKDLIPSDFLKINALRDSASHENTLHTQVNCRTDRRAGPPPFLQVAPLLVRSGRWGSKKKGPPAIRTARRRICLRGGESEAYCNCATCNFAHNSLCQLVLSRSDFAIKKGPENPKFRPSLRKSFSMTKKAPGCNPRGPSECFNFLSPQCVAVFASAMAARFISSRCFGSNQAAWIPGLSVSIGSKYMNTLPGLTDGAVYVLIPVSRL